MKSIRTTFLLLALLSVGLSFSACGEAATDKTEQKGKEYTAAYVCPMHCEGSGSEEMGKCPVCGMNYEKNTAHQSDGHEH
jgi:YHS domain-containing protein